MLISLELSRGTQLAITNILVNGDAICGTDLNTVILGNVVASDITEHNLVVLHSTCQYISSRI